jgi:hypothetical protein
MDWLVGHVPGAGVFRDGARALALCAPLLVAAAGFGAGRAAGAVPAAARPATVIALLIAPVAVLPDVAWGSLGSLQAVDYPSSYDRARDVVGDARGADVLLLPFTSYRAPDWNGGRKVLDPMGRYLRPDFVADDELSVSGRTVAGEDPRGAEVRQALGKDTPQQRAHALSRAGIGVVVVERDAPGTAPAIRGKVLLEDGRVTVLALAHPARRPVSKWWIIWMLAAWSAWLGCWGAGVVRLTRRRIGEVGIERRTRC